ncbi:zinc finger domain-containing protein [Streptomyces mirabilis]
MDLTPDQAAIAVERNDCPKCEAPAGSACRTCGGKTATKYHTARFKRPRHRCQR